MSVTENEYETLDVKAQLYIKDWGQGDPVILIHGLLYPLIAGTGLR